MGCRPGVRLASEANAKQFEGVLLEGIGDRQFIESGHVVDLGLNAIAGNGREFFEHGLKTLQERFLRRFSVAALDFGLRSRLRKPELMPQPQSRITAYPSPSIPPRNKG